MEPLWKKVNISSGEVIGNNIDILLQILLCLPPKSLIRFKSVCKQWFCLIFDAKFQLQHTLRNPRLSTSGLYYTRYTNLLKTCLPLSLLDGSIPPIPFMKQTAAADYLPRGMFIRVNHSNNGLILCSAYTSTTCVPQFLICNPTNQRYNLLPMLEGDLWVENVQSFLYFEPISTHYKVIVFKKRDVTYNFAIYSSEKKSWKTICYTGNFHFNVTHGLLSSGAVIHMMGSNYESLHVQFNVNTEEFSSSPRNEYPKISHPNKIEYFGENGGKLLLMGCFPGMKLRCFEMDEKEGSNCRWIMKLYIDLEDVFSLPSVDQPYKYEGRTYCGFAVLWATSQGGDFELVVAVHHKVVSYNHRTKVKKFLDLPPDHDQNSIWCSETLKMYPFIESLFPV